MSGEVYCCTQDPELDILDRFNRVSGIVREGKDRENIRKQLALEKEDLQICFVNDFVSDDEQGEDGEVEYDGVAEQIARCNISQKVGQIIVPIFRNRDTLNKVEYKLTNKGEEDKEEKEEEEEDEKKETQPRTKVTQNLSDSDRIFRNRVKILQVEARQGLISARSESTKQIAEKRRVVSPNLTSLLGIQTNTKLNRRILSGLSLGQLHVILNDYLGTEPFSLFYLFKFCLNPLLLSNPFYLIKSDSVLFCS